MRRPSLLLCLSLPIVAACGGADSGSATDTAGATAAAAGAPAGETAGFDTPESVRYDGELDVFYVSNINGNPSQADNNGYIARVRADSTGVVSRLAQGGQNGVTLNAPKGMALVGDTLFVADIDHVRKFNRRTGAPLGSVSFASQRATFLNDVAVGPDGVYITDTGIAFDAQGGMSHPGVNRIFKLVGNTITEVARGDSLRNPNGITWDQTNNRFLLAPFDGTNVLTWAPAQQHPGVLVTGPGGYDGIELLSNGNVLVSSWTDSTVYIIHGGSHMMPLVRGVPAPADIGVDTKRNLVAVPLFNGGKVAYFRIE